jgi:RNA polymerase nonessential primary-like sigma factor
MTEYTYLKDALPEVYGLEIGNGSTDILLQPLLTTQQQLALLKLIKEDDPDKKQQVIAQNLRLVVNIAKRYSDRGVALFDLVREGTMGLIHALENFELEGGFRFAAYAARCVHQNIERAIMSQKIYCPFDTFLAAQSTISDASFDHAV